MNLSKSNIYIADDIHSSGLELLKNSGYNVIETTGISNDDLIDFTASYDALSNRPSALIVRSVRKINFRVLKDLKEKTKIKFICTASSGFDNIDCLIAKKMGIKILNVPDGNFISAAEHTLALILSISKNICKSSISLSESAFISSTYINYELYKKTIGIVGVGRVGSYLAKLCRHFGMNILGNDIRKNLVKKYKWIQFCTLRHLVKNSDIVTLHVPLDKSTKNLINKKLIGNMKRESILINCARGGIINEKSLISRLKSGKLFYAGIDVFENEPKINEDFKKLQNVLLTPHQAGKTQESKIRISLKLAERLIKQLGKY